MMTYRFALRVTNESFCLNQEKQSPGRTPHFFIFVTGSVLCLG